MFDQNRNAWLNCNEETCPKCNSTNVKFRYMHTPGAFPGPEQYLCQKCGNSWWTEGPDDPVKKDVLY